MSPYEFKDVVILFGKNENDPESMGVIFYEGQLPEDIEPEEIHVDTAQKTLSIIINGKEMILAKDLTDENMAAAKKAAAGFTKNTMGFFAKDAEGNIRKDDPQFIVTSKLM